MNVAKFTAIVLVLPLIATSLLTASLSTRFDAWKDGEVWQATFIHKLLGCSPLFHNFQTALSNRDLLVVFALLGFALAYSILQFYSKRSPTTTSLAAATIVAIVSNAGDLVFPALRPHHGDFDEVYFPILARSVLWLVLSYLFLRLMTLKSDRAYLQ